MKVRSSLRTTSPDVQLLRAGHFHDFWVIDYLAAVVLCDKQLGGQPS